MGSSQSTSFSIDPNGNIAYTKPQDEAKEKETIKDEPANVEVSKNEVKLEEPPKILETKEEKSIPDLSAIHIKDLPENHKSVFEEAERNLLHCYAMNKNQPLNCIQAAEEYKSQVRQQRNQTLKVSAARLSMITTVLFIMTSLLVTLTSVNCYGAMSIDLGSEWMKVGLVAPSVQMDIVLNAQSQRKTPMAIAFSNGERFIGDAALDVASKYPERTFTHFLDLAGKSMDDESVRHYKQRFPYADISSHEPNSTSILLNHPEGLKFTPLELIAMMIEHGHEQALNRLGNNELASDVVITIPPFFNLKERKVIEEAAKLVGLNVLRLTNVNSAFALSYGIFRHRDYEPESSNNRTSIIFFDQGASHTSVTLADYHLIELFDETTGISKNESLPTITIRAQVYDRFLGGFDMQLKLRDYLVDTFSKKNKIDKSKIFNRGRSSSKVLKESGRVKKVLSANNDFLVRIENVIDDIDFRHPISREEFENLNKELLEQRVRHLLDKLYEMPDVSRDDPIESVIIVGGNTRTPKLQQVLMDYFKLETLGKSINADEGAALAALYQAASLGRGFRVKKFGLEEFGEVRKRYDPSKIVITTTTPQPPIKEVTESSTQNASDATESSETTTATTTIPSTSTTTEPEPKIPDPNAIYDDSELKRMGENLNHWKVQDYTRLQRLSMMNSLESLLSQARQSEIIEQGSNLINEVYEWLEDGVPKDNLTLLAEKYASVYKLLHPPTTTTTTTTETPLTTAAPPPHTEL